MTADDALAAAAQGQARAKGMTDMVNNDVTGNGFPGFDAIWAKVWGVAQGVLNPQPTIASNERLSALEANQDATQKLLIGGAVAVGGFLLLSNMGKRRRTPARRYARMVRSRR